MGAGEGVDREAALDDAGGGRERRELDPEEFRSDRVADEADVGDADRAAVAKEPGVRLTFEMRFERLQRLRDPMAAPSQALSVSRPARRVETFESGLHKPRTRLV